MNRVLLLLVLFGVAGCFKPFAPQDTALKGEYDRVLKENQGHAALVWYSGIELCRIEGKDRQQRTVLAIYFVRRVVDPKRYQPDSKAEAIVWRDQNGKWFTGRWQPTSIDLSEITVTTEYVQDGKPSDTFTDALVLLIERKKEGIK